MSSRLQLFFRALIEATWLLAAAIIPLFFNISSVQVFELDKVFLLKFFTIISCAAWLVTRIPGGGLQWRSFLGSPLVRPILALAGIVLLSSIFSIAPAVSWWGLYTRAQGTIAFFCYILLFLIAVAELRSAAQLRRLQFTIILASFPVSGYAILQFLRVDPIPWSNAILDRSSGSMGNPIFLGGYLAMVIPLTLCRLIAGCKTPGTGVDRKPRLAFILCSAAALVLQLTAFLFTQSRGPVAGLAIAGYLCLFVFFVMHRATGRDRPAIPLRAALLGIGVPVLALAVARIVSGLPQAILLACLSAVAVLAGFLYWLMWRLPRGRGWLWVSWLAQTATLLILLAVYPAEKIVGMPGPAPLFGRLVQFSDTSVSGRRALWETAVRFLRSDSPLHLPGGAQDRYRFLRRAIGYGPENSGLAAHAQAVPLLVQIHTQEEADRFHNETFENLLTTGYLGALAYLALIAAAFYHSFRVLGLISEHRGRFSFMLFAALGPLAGAGIPWLAGFPYMTGIGVHLGLLAGMFAYAAWSGFRNRDAGSSLNSGQWWVLGILGAVASHFVETGFGISVTPTRLYFYLLLAVLSVLSVLDLTSGDEAQKQRHPKPARWLQDPRLPCVALSASVLLVESWCYTFNAASEKSALAVFLKTWFVGSGGWQIKTFGTLMLVLLTICGSIGLMYSETTGVRAARSFSSKAVLILAALWFVMGILSASFWAAPESLSSMAHYAEPRITLLLFALLLSVVAAAFALMARQSGSRGATAPRLSEMLIGIVVAAAAVAGIWKLTLQPAWADVTYRLAEAQETAGNPAGAVPLYERAAQMAPWVVQYRLSLGRAQGMAGNLDPGLLKKASLSFQSALSLNPLDPAAHRAIGSFHMRIGESSPDPGVRKDELKTALSSFREAALLSPNYPDAYNEMGRCHFLLGEDARADELYQKSLRLNPNYSRTHMFLGEMRYRRGKLDQALQSFAEAARLDDKNLEAKRNVGFLLALLGRRQEAIQANLSALQAQPGDPVLLARLASLYFGAGNYNTGLSYARKAYEVTPQRPGFDEFVEQLKK